MRKSMKLAMLVVAFLVAVPATAGAKARHNSCYHDALLTAYSSSYHRVAKLHGHRAPGRNIRAWGITDKRGATCPHIRKSLRTLRRMLMPPAATVYVTTGKPYVPPAQTSTVHAGGTLSSIAACESGGNYATNTGNGFYGAYQFTLSTWASVGGSGNPAAASPAEQDKRAAMLYAREGPGPWPVCGR